MPIKVVQANQRIAEVQFVCDSCGKLVKTSLIPNEEVEAQRGKGIFCCNCKVKRAIKK